MKIIFLNAWYGTNEANLRTFLDEHIESTDVFCFMEADNRFRNKFINLNQEFIEVSADKEVDDEFGAFQSTYIKKGMMITSIATVSEENYLGYGLHSKVNGLNILNVHGVARPGDKLDNAIRLEQSEKIIKFMEKIDGPKIVGGDFNLNPETESVKMFEKAGYRNLVKEYKIETTRNHFSWDLYPDKQKFADYLFVSPEIKVKSFEVPKNEVSDHLPLILEIGD